MAWCPRAAGGCGWCTWCAAAREPSGSQAPQRSPAQRARGRVAGSNIENRTAVPGVPGAGWGKPTQLSHMLRSRAGTAGTAGRRDSSHRPGLDTLLQTDASPSRSAGWMRSRGSCAAWSARRWRRCQPRAWAGPAAEQSRRRGRQAGRQAVVWMEWITVTAAAGEYLCGVQCRVQQPPASAKCSSPASKVQHEGYSLFRWQQQAAPPGRGSWAARRRPRTRPGRTSPAPARQEGRRHP